MSKGLTDEVIHDKILSRRVVSVGGIQLRLQLSWVWVCRVRDNVEKIMACPYTLVGKPAFFVCQNGLFTICPSHNHHICARIDLLRDLAIHKNRSDTQVHPHIHRFQHNACNHSTKHHQEYYHPHKYYIIKMAFSQSPPCSYTQRSP